jgi:anti-sigma B factor antagonist
MDAVRSPVVRVRGEHDIATKDALARAISRAAQRNDADVIVDLSEVTFLDASTIGVLVGSHQRLRDTGRSLRLRAPSPSARRLVELCDLGQLIEPEVAAAP